MNKTNLVPLLLTLTLVGCNRADSTKTASSNSPDTNPPASYAQTTATANKTAADAADQSRLTGASAPTSPADAKPIADLPSTAVASTPSETPPLAAETSAPSLASASHASPAPTATDAATSDHAVLASSDRRAELKLTPDDIKSELATTGRVERSRAAGANEPTGPMDGLLVSQIKGKLQADSGTSAMAIEVEASKGVVTLRGSAYSLDQIGKAIAVSLDTGGITQVISLITSEATP